MMERFDHQGRVVVITGGGSGLGRAMALGFAEAGADVTVCGRRASSLDRTATAAVRDVLPVKADVTREEDLRRVAETTAERFGAIDVWINNAGVLERGALPEVDRDHIERQIDINVTGAILGCKVALEHMLPRKRGVILNVASYLADRAGASALVPVYTATKGAVTALTRSLAVRHGPEGIRVNALCPALIPTELNEKGLYPEGVSRSARNRELGERYPLRRIGKPEDVVGPALFLASDDASWITGHSLVIDGGLSAV